MSCELFIGRLANAVQIDLFRKLAQVSTPTISGSKKTKAEASANTRLKPTPAPIHVARGAAIATASGLKPPPMPWRMP